MFTTIGYKLSIWIMNATIWILPSWSLPGTYISSFKEIVLHIKAWDGVFPVEAIINVMIGIITFEIAILITKVVTGFISFIRGGGQLDLD